MFMLRLLFVASLAPALLSAQGRWGYIDTAGNWVIRPQYLSAYGFRHSDLSAVRCADDSWVYIDRSGRTGIPRRFGWASDFREGRAFAARDSGFGLIDTTGEFLSVLEVSDGLEFSGGRGAAQIGEGWGYVDRDGRLAIFPVFAEAGPFSEGLAVVGTTADDEPLYGCIDTTGAFVIPAQFSIMVDFSDGRARFRRPGELDWGFIDRSGSVVIDTGNGVVGDFCEGLARVERNGLSGFIDTTGRVAIEPQYEDAAAFSEGMAAAKKDGKWGYIDRTGRFVIAPQFDLCNEFSEGRALVNTGGEYRFLVGFVGGATCYVDRSGRPAITLPMRDARNFHRGLAAVKVDE